VTSHEGAAHDDWEDMSLPGGIAYSVSSRRGIQSLSHGITPSGPNGAVQAVPRGPARRFQPSVEPSYRPHVQALTTGFVNRPGGIQHRLSKPWPEATPNVDNAARRLFLEGAEETAFHELSIPWGKFLRNIPITNKEQPSMIARLRLDEICRRTNTYIPSPDSDSVHMKIFAEGEDDATHAIRELQTFEQDVRQTGVRPAHQAWFRARAFDGRVEDRAVRKNMQGQLNAAVLEGHKQRHFPYQAYLLWPFKVNMARFKKKYEDNILSQIQGNINKPCSIELCEQGVKYVKISTQEERHIHEVYLRMVNLIKEAVAQTGLFSCVNRLRLPRVAAYRDKVALDKHPSAEYFIPTIHGDPLPENETEKWKSLCQQSDAHNRLILRKEMESIIHAIQAPGQQVRIRLTYTELGFRVSTRPADGSDSHTFDDFCEMLREPQTVVAPSGLRPAEGIDFGDLVKVLESMPQFINSETRFTLHFDFMGSNRSTLRLEREMYIGMHGDLETSANRWLQFADSVRENDVLEFNMLDFEHPRANYQVHIGKTNIYEPDSRDKQLQSFSHNVSYKYDPAGLCAAPRRRAVFPPGHQALVRHVEISIARFNFNGADARFELLRKDFFDANAHNGSQPSKTEWYAQFYYPEWDSLLGEFGSLKPGEQVSWPRDMNSFFIPPMATGDLRPLPKGFGGFMKEAEQIQILLQAAIERLEEGSWTPL
jgi:hypothetical protein